MNEKKPKAHTNPITLYSALLLGLVVLNFAFILFSYGEAKTVGLLKSELQTLENQNKIITSANEIYLMYQGEVSLISNVFPSEETIPLFIGQLEDLLRSVSNEYFFRFTSVTPIKENDVLFLPVAVTMKVDLSRLEVFLNTLELLPYMTHIVSISSKNPSGFTSESDVQIVFKIYVQNPFVTK